jgi:hypothetical protein
MSDENELVWQVAGEYGAFKPQVLFGKPVLVYWTGSFLPLPWGTGLGHVEILDDTYTKIHSVKISGKEHNFVPAAGLDPEKIPSFVDGHEAYISSENTLVVGAFNVTPYDLSAFGGPVDGWMHDSLMFELDVKTGKVLNRWSALDHIDQLGVPYGDLKYPLDDMGRNITHPYRFFHMNSANKLSDGSYLVSSRQLCSVYRIAPNGTVQWILQVSEDCFLSQALSCLLHQHELTNVSRAAGRRQEEQFQTRARRVLLLSARCTRRQRI